MAKVPKKLDVLIIVNKLAANNIKDHVLRVRINKAFIMKVTFSRIINMVKDN